MKYCLCVAEISLQNKPVHFIIDLFNDLLTELFLVLWFYISHWRSNKVDLENGWTFSRGKNEHVFWRFISIWLTQLHNLPLTLIYDSSVSWRYQTILKNEASSNWFSYATSPVLKIRAMNNLKVDFSVLCIGAYWCGFLCVLLGHLNL